ncbi:MAG: arsenic resistance protein, partial [Spirochaetota bacterium]
MNRFNIIFRKYILFWALAAMVVGYLAGRYNPYRVYMLRVLITPLLFIMIFIMIFPTNLRSLLKLKYYTLPMIISFILFLISPFLAYLVSGVIPQDFRFLRTGIIISSTVPPEAMLSAWTGFLEGDILLSLIIQSFTFIMWILLVPFGLSLFFGNSSGFALMTVVKNLFFLIVIPFIIAGFLKKVFKEYLTADVLERLKPTLSSISGLIEIFVILISVGLSSEIIAKNPIIILWGFFTSVFYYALTFIIALYLTRLFRLEYHTSIPLVYENATKNLPIAMAVAISSFQNQTVLG